MPAGYYPIIFVRGFAATQSEINEAVDDPFSGFNVGSTIHRPDALSARPEPVAFEGPLVRLINDYGYIDAIEQGKHNQSPRPAFHPLDEKRTIWVFRYYDNVSSRFDDQASTRDEMVELGRKLYAFVGEVREKTKSDKVHLVAHSMGGLVSRCLIQKIYAERRRLGTAPEVATRNVREIARFFTYATPHNGIHSQYAALDILGNILTSTGVLGADVFREDAMVRYLTDDDETFGFEANRLTELPPEDAFCLVGTNAADYPVARSLSRRVIGPDSDGLVLIRNAFLKVAGRAYLHRSHSGPFGIVNSEEAYQHLVNFLFGKVLILELGSDDGKPHPEDRGKGLQVDVTVARAGGAELSYDASRAKYCPVRLRMGFLRDRATLLTLPVPNFSADSPLNLKVAFGFYVPADETDPTKVPLLPDWNGVLSIFGDSQERTTMAWQASEEKPAPTNEIAVPESFRLLKTKLKITLGWRESTDTDPRGANIDRPVDLGGGGGQPMEDPAAAAEARRKAKKLEEGEYMGESMVSS